MILASPNAIAQEAIKIWKVGVLWHAANPQGEGPMYQAFTEAMRDLAYVEGRNIKYYHTFVDENYDRFPANAQQLVEQKSAMPPASCPFVSMTHTVSLQWTARCARTIPRDGLRVVEPLRHQDEATRIS